MEKLRLKTELINKVRNRNAKIAVIGLGYVGLPAAAVFADAGFPVAGVDIKNEIVETVSQGKSDVKEPGLNDLLRKVIIKGKLKATTKTVKAVKKADITIICVQTPLNKRKQPNLEYLKKACKKVAAGLSKGKLVIVESTVPPGTTKNMVRTILEKTSGLRCGEDFWLVHCPERILPGNALKELTENSRIIGGYTKDSSEIAFELYKRITQGTLLITDCTSAEIAKLSENAFRDVNIAFANELALICEEVGVDVQEAIALANTHPRVKIHSPGCGVGGPCLPKDPCLLLHPVARKKAKFGVMKPSRELNDYMPNHTVQLVIQALKRNGKAPEKSKVALLGLSYKGNSNDARNSPAERIIHGLTAQGIEIVVYDPLCEENFGSAKARNISEAVHKVDCIVVTTDNEMFKKLDLKKVRALTNDKPVIVDGRRIINPSEAKKHGFYYVGIGYFHA